MKSELTIKEFKGRLAEITSPEKDFYLLTPYNLSGTIFCGRYDDTTFELTRNSFWQYIKIMKIKGEYKALNNKATEVIYEVGMSTRLRSLSFGFLGLMFIIINTSLFVNRANLDLTIFMTINGFLTFAFLWGVAMNWMAKKIVNQRFKEAFEIDVSPTDLYGV
jgi:hypothetical protein